MRALDNAPLETSLESFLQEVQPKLKALFSRHRIPAEDTEDILQQTLLALVYQWEKVRDPEAWLVGTVRNKCRLYWRERRRRLYQAVDAVMLEWMAGPEPPAQERRDLWRDLEASLEHLPERCRSLLKLRYGLGYEAPEVARYLGYSPLSISKVTNRCIAALTKRLVSPRAAGVEDEP
ncbi:MAG: sigma-70 family RNA polymerase sigma factor [Acidobacteriota bacterium]